MNLITPLYAGLIGLMFIWLSGRVILGRYSAKVSVGDGGDSDLFKRIRAQQNCAEYAPLGLILLGLAEFQGAPFWVVHSLGASLVIGRLAHAIGFGATPQIVPLRQVGMVLTFAMLIATAVANIGHALIG